MLISPTIIGIFCTLLFTVNEYKRRSTWVFWAAACLIVFGFEQKPIIKAIHILAADSLVLFWCISRLDWMKPRAPSDLGFLISIVVNFLLFLIINSQPYDVSMSTSIIFLYCLIKPFLWFPQSIMDDREATKLGFVSSILPVVAVMQTYPIQTSIDLSGIGVFCAALLFLTGVRVAVPILLLFAICHLDPVWAVFFGATLFAVFLDGWSVKALYGLITIPFIVQFNQKDEPIFWVLSVVVGFILGVMAAQKRSEDGEIQRQWAGIAVTAGLLIWPIYLNPDQFLFEWSLFDGMTAIAPFTMVLTVISLLFFKKRLNFSNRFPLKSWSYLVNYCLPTNEAQGSEEIPAAYRVQSFSTASVISDVPQVLLWLFMLACALFVFGGLI